MLKTHYEIQQGYALSVYFVYKEVENLIEDKRITAPQVTRESRESHTNLTI